MVQTSAQSLISGYRSYAAAPELADVAQAAPAATPAILSFIALSTVACGAGISVISAGGTGLTIAVGC